MYDIEATQEVEAEMLKDLVDALSKLLSNIADLIKAGHTTTAYVLGATVLWLCASRLTVTVAGGPSKDLASLMDPVNTFRLQSTR